MAAFAIRGLQAAGVCPRDWLPDLIPSLTTLNDGSSAHVKGLLWTYRYHEDRGHSQYGYSFLETAAQLRSCHHVDSIWVVYLELSTVPEPIG